MKTKIGVRYRIDRMNDPYDGQTGTLEHSSDARGWMLMGDGRLHEVPLASLRDKGVLQKLPEQLRTVPYFVRMFDVFDEVLV